MAKPNNIPRPFDLPYLEHNWNVSSDVGWVVYPEHKMIVPVQEIGMLKTIQALEVKENDCTVYVISTKDVVCTWLALWFAKAPS